MADLDIVNSVPLSDYLSLVKKVKYFQILSEKIISKQPLDNLLDEIISSSKRLIDAEASSLLLLDKETNFLHFHIATGEKGKTIESSFIRVGDGIAGWVAENKKAIGIDDCYADERFSPEFDVKTGFKTRNMLCAPMIRKGELLGVIQVINKSNNGNFDDLDLDFFQALASQCAISIENARLVNVEIKSEQIKHELETARSIQQNLLPKSLPTFADLDIDVELIPAKEVGGDYYNVIKISDTKTLIFLADVSGKSISAALIVSTIYSFMQTFMILNQHEFNLIAFVESLNKFLISSTTSDKFATAWFALFDHETTKLHSINAGHNPIYVYLNSSLEVLELSEGGLILGSIDLPYVSETISMAKNDCIVFYTDGITEAMNINDEEYGEESFKSVISLHKNKTSSEVLKEIIQDVNKFKGTAEQSDDITCGVLKF